MNIDSIATVHDLITKYSIFIENNYTVICFENEFSCIACFLWMQSANLQTIAICLEQYSVLQFDDYIERLTSWSRKQKSETVSL
jgi:hypothetical protein